MTNSLRLIPFLFEDDTTVRILDRDGQPWFLVTDFGPITGIKNPTEAVRCLGEDEKATITLGNSEGIPGNPDRVIVSESGLYALILRSHAAMKPGTKAWRFRMWVTGELLPSIRKTGRYAIEAPHPQSLPGEKALTWPEKCRIVEMYLRMSGARAAAEKALSLGFESVPALDAMLRQGEFKFIIDLNTNGPTDVAEVN
jgi:prophage antirepressor-like protein